MAVNPYWLLSNRGDPLVRPLADRHYNRQKIGADNFMPPGRALVLRTEDNRAYWGTSWPYAEYVLHDWAGAWICSAFRNEGPIKSSKLIKSAVAVTLDHYGIAPPHGFITFVDPAKTTEKLDPGFCFLVAGWRRPKCPDCKGGEKEIWGKTKSGSYEIVACPRCKGDGLAYTREEKLVVWQLLPEKMKAPAQVRDGQISCFTEEIARDMLPSRYSETGTCNILTGVNS